MTRSLALIFTLFAAPALAHPGHIGEMAGHNHWLAGAASGAAVAIAIWGAIMGRKEDETGQVEAAVEAQLQKA
jgi:hypothetical protein